MPLPTIDTTLTDDNTTLTVRETAAILKVTERTVRNYLVQKRNPLPHSKPGGRIIIHKSDLKSWIRR